MLKIAAQILTALSPAWLSAHLFFFQGGYREEVLDEFLTAPSLDTGLGAIFVFKKTFIIPLIAFVVTCVHWQKEKSRAALNLFLTAAVVLMLGLIIYFALPSHDDAMEHLILEQLKAQPSQN
jgi:hypothetical protein